ncbi:hypothetical protein BDR04DRAFT_1034967, partial [Suillus decipiens]
AQTFIIYYSSQSVTGVCAAFTMATTSAVVWPSSVVMTASSTLAWRNRYLLPIVVFPLGALAIAVPVLLSLQAIQPTDDLHCDASHPIWGRFLGYAGLSMIPTVPCFFLSAIAAHRVFKMHTVHQELFKFTAPHPHSMSAKREVGIIEPSCPPIPDPDVGSKSAEFGSHLMDRDIAVMPRNDIMSRADDMDDTAAMSNEIYSPRAEILPSSPSAPKRSSDASQRDESEICDERASIVPIEECTTTLQISSERSLAPAIWRLILFQMAFFIIQFLAALSTIIDVARHRQYPTPFGTQHVALVLVGWGPSIVFGHLPAVRRRLLFWRHPDPSSKY